MFARAKYVAGKWPKNVGAHAQMGLPRLKLAQAMMEYSSWHLLNRVTVASSAASAILNLSERQVDAVKSGSLRCVDEFKQQENKSSENVRRQANLLS